MKEATVSDFLYRRVNELFSPSSEESMPPDMKRPLSESVDLCAYFETNFCDGHDKPTFSVLKKSTNIYLMLEISFLGGARPRAVLKKKDT